MYCHSGLLDSDYCCWKAIQIQFEFSAIDNYLPWPNDKLLTLMKHVPEGCRRSHVSSLIKSKEEREKDQKLPEQNMVIAEEERLL